MPQQDKVLARVLMRAALPLMKVLIAEDENLAAKYRGWNKAIQFQVKGEDELACHLLFTDGTPDIRFERHPEPTLDFVFTNASAFNAMFTGGIAFPKIKGMFAHPVALIKTLLLMLRMTILLPTKLPKDPEGRALKVKLSLYFITVALSQLNKAGDEDMCAFTRDMPDRVFQWSVLPDGPQAYLRVRGGKTKAGRGVYTRRRPFIHMVFTSTDAAFQVLTSQVDMVDAMKLDYLRVEGSPEYGKDIGAIMKKIEAMVAGKAA